jgi:hypothetical protein
MDFLKKYLWLISLSVGFIGFLIVWFFLPHKNQIDEIWWLAVKFLVFGFVIVSIAFFPNKSKNGFLMVIAPFFIFLGYIIPRMSYFGIFGTVNDSKLVGECYTTLYLLLYPLIVLTTSFAFRMGGNTPGKTIKIAVCGIMIIFSGFLDVLWNIANGLPIPETLNYAYHIIIFFGRPPAYSEALVFAICHIPLFITVLLLPLDKWFMKLNLLDDNSLISRAG